MQRGSDILNVFSLLVADHVSAMLAYWDKKSSINQITSILDEFLLLTKIEDGIIELNPEILDLNEYLNDICENFKVKTKPG